MVRLGTLHRGEEFILDNARYRILRADGNGYAICRNLESGKTEKVCLDCEVEARVVEVLEQMKGDKE